jgi:hypothetical protein
VPLILTAEVCSWYAVLTTWNFGHVAENSLWGLTGTIVLVSLLAVGPYGLTVPRWVFFTWCLGGAAYVAFIFFIDVPMYWSRWVADELSGRSYMTLAQGARDAIERRVVSYRWEDWKSEVGWMSLYFSAGVWVSLSLIRARAEYAVARTSSALRLPQ